jgi:hypothetical protein
MNAILTGFPAYGRRYKSSDDMRKDFLAGKDFSASYQGGPYFSIRDFTENDNCSSFNGVLIIQPGKEGTEFAVTISRRHMCEAKVVDVIKPYITEGPKA